MPEQFHQREQNESNSACGHLPAADTSSSTVKWRANSFDRLTTMRPDIDWPASSCKTK